MIELQKTNNGGYMKIKMIKVIIRYNTIYINVSLSGASIFYDN